MAAGHSLVAPCGLGKSSEAGGVAPGAEESACQGRRTLAAAALGGENGSWVGGLFYNWDVQGVCRSRSTCAHVNRTEGGVRPPSPVSASLSSPQNQASPFLYDPKRSTRQPKNTVSKKNFNINIPF